MKRKRVCSFGQMPATIYTNPIYIIMRWPAGCLIFLLASCHGMVKNNSAAISTTDAFKEEQRIERAFIKIDSAEKIITSGDLIVRTGNDFTSESLRNLNQQDKTYSHCGIASVENDTLFIYHALGGEWNPNQQVRKDVLKFFAEPYSNRGIGIYRYNLSSLEIEKMLITVKKLYQMGITFDMKFDLQSNDRMYCSEFVYKSLVMGTRGKLQFTTSQIGDFAFVGVDDLFIHPLCKELKKIRYQ